nr:putative ribonuclease H-like domain-containing protein [Tanacetum cinerariifolium]
MGSSIGVLAFDSISASFSNVDTLEFNAHEVESFSLGSEDLTLESLEAKSFVLTSKDLSLLSQVKKFCWVFFLEHKDVTYPILRDFINLVENQLNKKVKAIRCDNGTEFKNALMIELCGSKRIKREYSNARTPQQNRVAERKNKTLIEAARTIKLQVQKAVPPGSLPVPGGYIPVPVVATIVSTDDVPVHSSSSTDSFFDDEPTARFRCPSDLGNHDPSPGVFSSPSYDDEFGAALNNVASTVEKDGYEVWAMKMEYWITNNDMNIWKVIQNGNSMKRIGRDRDRRVIILSPMTAEEYIAIQRESKAITTLL